MRKWIGTFAALMLFFAPALSIAQTRALLVACREFMTMPNLGSAVSGNLHMMASALIGAGLGMNDLSIEDGTIGSASVLANAVSDAFLDAADGDLSILYLCTHGILSADDNQPRLLLGDGRTESTIGANDLFTMLNTLPGEKLLIVDACYSGALIERGTSRQAASVFVSDPSIHVLTSANGYESSWYYDSKNLANGAVSYFASALSSGLGLYGTTDADTDGDGNVTLNELFQYLRISVPSSACQLLSTTPQQIVLPSSKRAMLNRPLTGFSFSPSLVRANDPTLEFSFTVTSDTAVQYRLIRFADGAWDWANASSFMDTEFDGETILHAGRKSRTITLSDADTDDNGYTMLQVFSVADNSLTLCAERLIAVQPSDTAAPMLMRAPQNWMATGKDELPICIVLTVPAELSLTITDAQGTLVKRLASAQLTRPVFGENHLFYWDGRDMDAHIVSDGIYTVTAETQIGRKRQRSNISIHIEDLSHTR